MGAEVGDASKTDLRRVADALSRLVKQHFDLVRAELRVDASRYRQDATLALAAIPLTAMGLLLLELALAALLAKALGIPGALALLGALNLILGVGLALFSARRIQTRRAALRGTNEELRRDRETLREVRRRTGPPVRSEGPG